MKITEGYIPDLEDGFTIVYGEENSWRTEIRSILQFKNNDQNCFLTHECRAEALSKNNIFTGVNYEFAPVKTPDGNFNIRSGLYNYGFGLTEPNTVYEKTEIKIEAKCTEREVVYYGIDEMIERNKNDCVGRYFIDLEYTFEGKKYRSFFRPDI